MADYITTYTGVHFYPLSPNSDDIRIEDIAHSLSLLCRANGHYRNFYSIADHCIDCAMEAKARGYSEYIIMLCLLHDAAEAYISDVPRPVKNDLCGINDIEDRLLNMIFEKFTGRIPDKSELKILSEIDDAMLYHEFKIHMGEELKYGDNISQRKFISRIPTDTEFEFLEIYKSIKKSERNAI